MKKILLTTIALIGLVLACDAMSITEKIILSKTTETAPISLVSDGTDLAILCGNTAYDNRQANSAKRLAIMILKNIGSFLVKGLCTLAKPDQQNKPAISYVNNFGYDTRLAIRTNFSSALR